MSALRAQVWPIARTDLPVHRNRQGLIQITGGIEITIVVRRAGRRGGVAHVAPAGVGLGVERAGGAGLGLVAHAERVAGDGGGFHFQVQMRRKGVGVAVTGTADDAKRFAFGDDLVHGYAGCQGSEVSITAVDDGAVGSGQDMTHQEVGAHAVVIGVHRLHPHHFARGDGDGITRPGIVDAGMAFAGLQTGRAAILAVGGGRLGGAGRPAERHAGWTTDRRGAGDNPVHGRRPDPQPPVLQAQIRRWLLPFQFKTGSGRVHRRRASATAPCSAPEMSQPLESQAVTSLYARPSTRTRTPFSTRNTVTPTARLTAPSWTTAAVCSAGAATATPPAFIKAIKLAASHSRPMVISFMISLPRTVFFCIKPVSVSMLCHPTERKSK